MSSTVQDPPDFVLLALLGEGIMSAVVEVCVYTLFYGLFILLLLQTTITYFKKKQASRAQHWMFIASTTSFLIATAYEASLLASNGIIIYMSLVVYQELPLSERRTLVDTQLAKAGIVEWWAGVLGTIISDSIVVWRVVVLLKNRKWLKFLLFILLLGSFTSYLGFLIIISQGNYQEVNPWLSPVPVGTMCSRVRYSQVQEPCDPNSPAVQPVLQPKLIRDRGFANNFVSAGNTLSLATNVVSTALFGYIYWLYRRDTVAGLGKHRVTQAEKVLILLVESGVVFCIPQAIQFVLGFTSPSGGHVATAGTYAFELFTMAYNGLSAIYPTLVIALVNSHRTFDYIYTTNTPPPTISRGTNSQHTTTIQFAQLDPAISAETLPQPIEKSIDNNFQGV